MELENRGVAALLVVTRTFLPLVQAQAQARQAHPRLIVIDHPMGGLTEQQLADRIDAALDGVVRELRLLQEMS